jgi:hypothetical protein
MKSSNLLIIGWQEIVVFPDWKRIKMRAKVDTGAHSAAIHAEEYKIHRLPSVPHRPVNEEIEMKLKVGTVERPKYIWVKAPIVDYRNVKNSGGRIEERPFISTGIEFGNYRYPIILSVTNREKMKFPVLLGRTFLSGKFLIDPSAKSLFKQNSKTKKSTGKHHS